MAAWRRLSVEDGRPRRAGALAWLAAGAVALHLALLGGLGWTWERPLAVRAQVAPLRVRAVVVAPVRAVAAPPQLSDAPVAVAAPRARAAAARPATASPVRPPDATRPAPAPPARPPDAAVAVAAVEPPPPDADDDPPPVYRTRLPPSTTLRYAVGRGATEGTGELRWRVDADGYALDWQGRAGDAALPSQSSRGGVDAAGIAPLRFVDQRASRSALAVNFQRDAGRITFSRKAAAAPLAAGAQDRLSWLLQLAAIVAAEPDLRERGREVRISIASAGGDVAVWRLRCEGTETLAGVRTLHYLREPRGPYETRAEVWLDADDGRYLPVRAAWRSGPADEGIELRLHDAVAVDRE